MATCDCKPPIPPRPPRRHPFPAMSAHFSHTLDDLVEHYVQAQYFEIKGETGVLAEKDLKTLLESRSNLLVYQGKVFRFSKSEGDLHKYVNASTTDDLTDDYGNERLDEIFNDYLVQSVKDIRFIIQIKQLTHEGMEYYVDYQYIWNFRYEVAGQSYWQSKNDTNRMTLVKEDGAWKIRGGL